MSQVEQVRAIASNKSYQQFGAPKKMGSITFMLNDQENSRRVPHACISAFKKDPFTEGSLEEFNVYMDSLVKKSCWLRIISLLERKDRSSYELRTQLTDEGFDKCLVDEQIYLAQSKKLLQDNRFAESFIQQKKLQGWDRFRIELELKRKGIQIDILPDYPKAYFSFEDSLNRAINLLSKKSIPQKNPYEKLYRFLASKGYASEIIKEAIKHRLSEDD